MSHEVPEPEGKVTPVQAAFFNQQTTIASALMAFRRVADGHQHEDLNLESESHFLQHLAELGPLIVKPEAVDPP